MGIGFPELSVFWVNQFIAPRVLPTPRWASSMRDALYLQWEVRSSNWIYSLTITSPLGLMAPILAPLERLYLKKKASSETYLDKHQ